MKSKKHLTLVVDNGPVTLTNAPGIKIDENRKRKLKEERERKAHNKKVAAKAKRK